MSKKQEGLDAFSIRKVESDNQKPDIPQKQEPLHELRGLDKMRQFVESQEADKELNVNEFLMTGLEFLKSQTWIDDDERNALTSISKKLTGVSKDLFLETEKGQEKESNIQKLFKRIEEVIDSLKADGLKQDAEIIGKLPTRIERVTSSIKTTRENREKEAGTRLSMDELRRWLPRVVPIAHEIGDGGGYLYVNGGFPQTKVEPEALKNEGWGGNTGGYNKEYFDKEVKQGGEIINFSLSKEGEAELYRFLGILKKDEEALDIPHVYERMAEKENSKPNTPVGGVYRKINDTRNYNILFPTNIDGVSLRIIKDARALDKNASVHERNRKTETRIVLEFENKFIDELFAKSKDI